MSIISAAHGATLLQTFEDGEVTADWGSGWTNGSIVATFLDLSAGGESAGGGSSAGQSFSRQFRNNTAGLDVTTAYTITMDVQVESLQGAASGSFQIIDGAFGSSNAANLGIRTEDLGDGNFVYHWQARDNNTGWQDLGITLNLANPYKVELSVNPATFTYSATVSSLTTSGSVITTASAGNLAFDQNVITNGQNGTLLFNIQASAGEAQARVDNINISSIPEPSAIAVISASFAVIGLLRRR